MASSHKQNPVLEDVDGDACDEEEDGNESPRKIIHEKQISVDPMSLNHHPKRLPPPLVKPKFASTSLPSSAASSPHANPSYLPNSSSKNRSDPSCPHLPRSKSCGDGRSSQPSDEFDILPRRRDFKIGVQASESNSKVGGEEVYPPRCTDRNDEKEFKCGAMCLFLPGFARKKQERSHLRRRAGLGELRADDGDEDGNVLSRVASLEKFECASWASAAILGECDGEEDVNAYFDLPLELIRGGDDEAHSPVRTAFVFDREEPKGVLKKSSTSKSGPRKSCESSASRHVRFSTSTPVSYPPSPGSACVTPRLFQAREEFNALLEAQNSS